MTMFLKAFYLIKKKKNLDLLHKVMANPYNVTSCKWKKKSL